MIVPMKKAALFVLKREERAALSEMKKLGILHIDTEKRESEPLKDLERKRDTLERALTLIPRVKKPVKQKEVWDFEEALETARSLIALQKKIEENREEQRRIELELDRLSPWGDFDPALVASLAAKGVHLALHELSPKELAALSPDLFVFPLGEEKGVVFAMIASLRGDPGLPHKRLVFPAAGMSALRERREAAGRETARLEKKREESTAIRESLEKALRLSLEAVEFEEVRLSMNTREEILYITGYVPAPETHTLREAARRHSWGLFLTDPDPDDNVPTLIRNPKPIRIVRPVFEFLGTVPGYREKDISLFFLVFFSIFYGMIVGDAAYGCIFLVIAFLIRFLGPASKKKNLFSYLLMLTSMMTIIWGAITGTWFNISPQIITTTPPFSWFVIPEMVASAKNDTTAFMMHLCFIIGAVHLTLAHVWAFVSKLPRLKSVTDLGWIGMIWGGYFIIRYLILKMDLFPFAPHLFLGGFLTVLLFNEQNGKFFKGMLMGLAKFPFTFLSSISALADIISYVRLFAVGLAGVKVEEAFNNMAASFGFDFPNIIGAVLILLFGHSLNLALGIMSVIVHGVRLNMLEFSGHLGQEWTGRAYRPFKYTESERTDYAQ